MYDVFAHIHSSTKGKGISLMPYKILSIVDTPPKSNAPEWAINLINEVKQSADMRDRTLILCWKRSQSWYSSGRTSWPKGTKIRSQAKADTISITEGNSLIDAKMVVLHELAHWLISETHTDRFWILAFQLYAIYMPEHLETIKQREGDYKKRSSIGYAAMKGDTEQ